MQIVGELNGGQPQSAGGPPMSKPTWSKTFGCSATSAFLFPRFVAAVTGRDKSDIGGEDDDGLVADPGAVLTADQSQRPFCFVGDES
jgi:hypothetical protein